MSMLKSWGAYVAIILVLALSICCWVQHTRINGLTSALELSNGIIRQLQQSIQLSEAASQKYQERKDALQQEQARQQKLVNDVLGDSKDWASEFLPASVLRLFSNETTDTNSVPATDGASR